MTDTLHNASHATAIITEQADLAATLLQGQYAERSRINGLGILHDPATYLLALRTARAAIDTAIAAHEGATWPTPDDYKAY